MVRKEFHDLKLYFVLLLDFCHFELSSALCIGGTWEFNEGKNCNGLTMLLQSPPLPWLSRTDVTMGDDRMEQSVDGCKDILPHDQMKAVSSLFTLIAPQGTMLSPTAVSWRCASVLT